MKIKTVEVKGRNYQLRKMDATAGGFIYMRMVGVLMNAAQDAAVRSKADVPDAEAVEMDNEAKAKSLITLAVMNGMKYEDVQFAYRYALQAVSVEAVVKDTIGWLPVSNQHGVVVDHELQDDPELLTQVAIASLSHSLAPFFSTSGSSSAPPTISGSSR